MDDKTICLVRPPDKDQEDISMNEDKLLDETVVIKENVLKETENINAGKEKFTVFDIMTKIDELRDDLAYINDIIAQVGDSDEEKLSVLERIVRIREETYNKLIHFYEKVYDDVRPRAFSAEQRAEFVLGAIEKLPAPAPNAPAPDYADLIKSVIDAI